MTSWLVAGWLVVMASLPVLAQTGPAFQWAVSGGGADNETVAGVATDAAGNVYVTGTFTNTAAFGGFSLTSAGGTDIFLAKYATNGALVWVRQYGDMGNEMVRGIAANPAGGVFIVGSFEGTATFGTNTLTSAGGADAFVARMETLAGNVIWAASAGGAGEDRAVGIYGSFTLGVVGEFSGTATFGGATGGGTTTLTSAGGQDVFGWALIDATGSFVNAISVGGTGDETCATASTSGGSGFSIPLAGSFTGTMTAGSNGPTANVLTSTGGLDGFLATWEPTFNRVFAAVLIGGPDDDQVQAVSVSSFRITLAGRFGSTVTCFPRLGLPSSFPPISLTNSSAAGSDVFWVSYNDFNSTLYPTFATAFGGAGDDNATGVALDSARVSYLTGTFTGAMQVGGSTLTSVGQQDAFVAKLTLSGTPVWARALGGAGNDLAPGLTVYFPGGNAPVVIAGSYETSITLGSTVLNAVGGSDVFVTSIEADPRIVTQPQSASVAFGATAGFSVVAGGTGPFTYQWFHTVPAVGTNPPVTTTLTNQTSSNLVINNVTSAEVGTYFVQVTGAFGSINSSSATLSLSQSLGITTQPLSRTVTRGSTAIFTVGVAGAGPFNFQWRRNGTNLLNAVTSVLTITNALLADEGVYDVVITDGITTITSFSAALFVNSPPFVTTQPQAQVLPPGTNVTLVTVVEGSAPLAFQWRRNGVVIPGATGATLTLTNLSAAHSGSYSLTVSNVFASVISDTAVLTVGIPPVIGSQPLGQAAPVGTNLVLSVGATGIAPLAYQWFYAGNPISGATSATLSLTNAQTANSGNYYAQVSDGTITVNSSNVFVRVFTPFSLAAPRFTNNSTFSFSLGGDSGQYYRLEFSTNLTTWTALATNLAIGGAAAFSDNSISNQPGRFYRVTLLP